MKKLCLSLSVLLAACGLTVGSRYVMSVTVDPAQDKIITVSASESPLLAGAQAIIPAGALATRTVITIEPGLKSLVSDGEQLSPVVIWGPAGTTFKTPVRLTVPLSLSASVAAGELEVVAMDERGQISTISGLSQDAKAGSVTFKVTAFASFQVRRHHAGCTTDSSCAAKEVCVNGECSPSLSDGGISNGCASNADCGTTQQCINGACALRCTPSEEVCDGVDNNCNGIVDEGCNTSSDGGLVCTGNAQCGFAGECVDAGCGTANPVWCAQNADCGWGEYCVNSVCTPVPWDADAGTSADGGAHSCRANAECPASEVCVYGVCGFLCVPTLEVCDGVDNDCDGIVDNGCAASDGGYSANDGGYSYGDGGYSYGDGGYSYGDGGYSYGDGGYSYGDGGYSYGDGGYSYGDGGYSYGDGGIIYDDGGYSYGDGGIIYVDGGSSYGDGGSADGGVLADGGR